MKTTDKDIREIEELEDGSTIYEIGDPVAEEEEIKDESFYHNLALDFPEDASKRLSTFLLSSIEEDIASRKDWMDAVDKVKKYLGFSLEDSETIPFKMATRTYDTTLATALIRFYATSRAELLPQSGPVGFRINGDSSEELEEKGQKVRDYLNYYLTVEDASYYSDYERFLLYLGLYGSGFKKVYYDPITKKPLSRFIMPENFIVDGDCTSILESQRLTHVLHLSKREILLNQQGGVYRDVELSYLKNSEINEDDDATTSSKNKDKEVDLDAYTKRSLFPIYEVHTYLNLKDFSESDSDSENEIPSPYIVTIDKISKEILSIRRNWKEEDENRNRENYFVQYNYLPGFGIYGLGLAHLLGTNAITLTKLLRQLVDAGSFKNLPGGLRTKGFKQQNTDIIVGPGQFVEVDTGGIPMKEAFMPLPYSEPSAVLRELRLEIVSQCKELGSTSELGILDSKEDISMGTAMAMFEANNRIQSSVLRSIHVSFSQELQLIDKIIRSKITEESFSQAGRQQQITSEDFVDEISIIPISDPSVNSNIQKLMKAESVMRTAQQAPEMHNMREVFKLNYQAQGFDDNDIDSILKPEIQEEEILPLDPISENINILQGKAVKAAEWQEHAAHILLHGSFAEENPDLKPLIMDHIKDHQAMEYKIKMQQILGQNLPPLETIQNPEIQNAIAMAIAESYRGGEGENQAETPMDPSALVIAEIQQKAEETASRERIATQRTETDVFKAQLDFEKEKAKIESNEDIAILKSETELTKQGVNNGL